MIKKAAANRLNIFNVPINRESMDSAIDWIINKCQQPSQVTAHFVNASCLNIAYSHRHYRAILQKSHRVFADGSGIQLACRILRRRTTDNVNGTDLFPALCKKSRNTAVKIFLLGARPGLADKTAAAMSEKFPGLQIVGTHHGYFSQQQNADVIETINQSGANVLLVALGAPRQEIWINEYRDQLAPAVCMGVGGLFDYYSGRIPRAPLWMRRIGCEWVWRFLQEPKRLWQRYLIGNFIFVGRVIKQSLLGGTYAS